MICDDNWHEQQRKQLAKIDLLNSVERFEDAVLACRGLGDENRLGAFDSILEAIERKYL